MAKRKSAVFEKYFPELIQEDLDEFLYLAAAVRRTCHMSGTATDVNPVYRFANLALRIANKYFPASTELEEKSYGEGVCEVAIGRKLSQKSSVEYQIGDLTLSLPHRKKFGKTAPAAEEYSEKNA